MTGTMVALKSLFVLSLKSRKIRAVKHVVKSLKGYASKQKRYICLLMPNYHFNYETRGTGKN
jgi:hypothetical protein